MKISASETLGIGYNEFAVSARVAFESCRNRLRNDENLLEPLPPEDRIPWAAWCEKVTGKSCHGCVPVISAKWLVDHPHLPSQQELPPEAFLPHTYCSLLLFVSHRWESVAEPDPDGQQALFLSLFLAIRLDETDLEKVGIWYDYSVLPQEPRERPEEEAFVHLIRRIPEIQSVSHTLVCGSLEGIRDYAGRAWCLLEYFGGAIPDADFVSGGIAYRQALGHAVAKDKTAAVLQALAFLMMQYVSLEEGVWKCPYCGREELINSRLQQAHQCRPEAMVDDAIKTTWARLEKMEKILHDTGNLDTLPEYLQLLVQQRRHSFLEMLRDFNWALHLAQCRDMLDKPLNRLVTQEENETLRKQFSLCRDKYRRFMLRFEPGTAPEDRQLEGEAQQLNLRCTKTTDLSLVMRLMLHRSTAVLATLADSGLVDENGATAAHRAAEWQDLPILKRLISQNPALLECRDRMDNTLLHSAAFGYVENGLDLVEWLVGNRPEMVETRNRKGETPIAVAVQYGAPELTACFLLLSPKQVECQDNWGNTLLHLAAWNANLDFSGAIANQLLAHSSHLATIRNQQLETPLHTAAGCANVPMVRLLLRQQPSLITTVDAFGDTPLHKILNPSVGAPDIGERISEICELLLNTAPELAGIQNEEGNTPVQIAKQSKEVDIEVVKLLSGQGK